MTAMAEIRAQLQASAKAPSKPAWRPPFTPELRGWEPVVAWDGTLSHCGYVVIERKTNGVNVYDKGTIHITTDLTGYLATWDKARQLQSAVRAVMAAWGSLRQVVEGPAVRGNRLESSLIAGMLIWLETAGTTGTGCAQVSATHVSAVLCGNARLPGPQRKQAVKAAVARYVPDSLTRKWDEHQRDALAVGVTHLYDLTVQGPRPPRGAHLANHI